MGLCKPLVCLQEQQMYCTILSSTRLLKNFDHTTPIPTDDAAKGQVDDRKRRDGFLMPT